MDEKEQRDAELDTEKGLDSQSLKIKQEAGLELEAETESLFSDSAILSPFACPVDLIDPGPLTSSEASSPSPCGFQSFPSYTPPDSQSTSSTPLFETFGDVTLHETIPTICKEMYGDQQPPLYPRMYPCMTELEETLMLCHCHRPQVVVAVAATATAYSPHSRLHPAKTMSTLAWKARNKLDKALKSDRKSVV